MAKRVTAAKARASFKDVIDEVRLNGDRVKITRYGRTAAWLVPREDGRALEACADELDKCKEKQEAPASARRRPARSSARAAGKK